MDEEEEIIQKPEEVAPVEDATTAEIAAPEIPGWQKKVKEHYKDREFADDNELSTAAEQLIDELSDSRNKSREANQKLIEVFQTYEPVADFIADLMDDVPFPVALARHFDPEEFTPSDEDPDQAQWKEAAEQRRSKKAETEKFNQELTANKVESSKAFESFEKEKGMSQDEADAFIDQVENFLKDIYRGKVSTDFLNAMYKATDYDTALSTAREQASLKAKNENVELKKKTYDKPKGDGLPEVKSLGGMPETAPQSPKPRFLQSLDEMEKRQQTRI